MIESSSAPLKYHDIWCGTQHGFTRCDCTPGRSYNIDAKDQLTLNATTAPMRREPVAASLPTVNTDQIAAKHQPQLTGFTSRQTTLEARIAKLGRITPQIAQEAAELDTDARRWIDAFDSETKPIKDALFKAHRAFTGFCEKMSGSAAQARIFLARSSACINSKSSARPRLHVASRSA